MSDPRLDPFASLSAGASDPLGGMQSQNERELEQQRIADENAKSTLGDLIGADASSHGIGFIHDSMGEVSFAPTPGYELPADFKEQMKKAGIGSGYWDIFQRAHSPEHFDYLIGVAQRAQGSDEERARHGIVANILADVVSAPEMIALDAIAAPLGFSANVGRLANAARAGGVAAVENVAATALTSVNNPTVGAKDYASAAALGFAFGGAFGLRMGEVAKLDRAVSKIDAAVAKRDEWIKAHPQGEVATPDIAAAKAKLDADVTAAQERVDTLRKTAVEHGVSIRDALRADATSSTRRAAIREAAQKLENLRLARGRVSLQRDELVSKMVGEDINVHGEELAHSPAITKLRERAADREMQGRFKEIDDAITKAENAYADLVGPNSPESRLSMLDALASDDAEGFLRSVRTPEAERLQAALDDAHADLARAKASAERGPARPAEQYTGAPDGNDSMGSARVQGAYGEPDDVPGGVNYNDTAQARLDEALAESGLRPALLHARQSMAATFGKSKSALINWVGRHGMRESVGLTDRMAVNEEGATEMAKRLDMRVKLEWYRAAKAGYAMWRKETGSGRLSHKDYFEQIGRAMRGDLADAPASVLQMVEPTNKAFRRVLEDLQRSGVAGFEDVNSIANWLPRLGSREGFERIMTTWGLPFESIRDEVFAPAITRAWKAKAAARAEATGAVAKDIDPEEVKIVAGAMIKRLRDKASRIYTNVGNGIGVYDTESLHDALVAQGLSAERASAVLEHLTPTKSERSMHSHAKHRIDMDESFRADVTHPETGRTHSVGIADFYENDVNKLLTDYTREMSGWSALSQKLKVRSPADLERFYAQVQNEARNANEDPQKWLGRTELLVHSILGRSTEKDPTSGFSRAARMLRDHAYLTTMGQMGYTMLAEIGPTLAYAGFRNVLRAMPEAMSFYRAARDGTLTNANAREMEALFPIYGDYGKAPIYLKSDAAGERVAMNDTLGKRSVNALDDGQRLLKQKLGYLSGMTPIQDFLMATAARGMMYRMTQLASKDVLSGAELRRLRQYGLSEEMQQRVFGRLKGVDKDLTAAQFDTWAPEEREALSAYMTRATRHMVLEGDFGDSLGMQHTLAGKIVTQFRSFMIHSYEAHFLNSFHNWDDWRTWAMWTTSSTFAALGYSARAYLNTIGDDEKREKMLSPKAIFLNGAVMQSSWSSIAPAIGATAAQLGGFDDPFQYGRTTNLSASLADVTSIPAANSVTSLAKALAILPHGLRPDQQITKSDMQSLWRAMWLNNVTGIRNIGAAVTQDLPDNGVNTGTTDIFDQLNLE